MYSNWAQKIQIYQLSLKVFELQNYRFIYNNYKTYVPQLCQFLKWILTWPILIKKNKHYRSFIHLGPSIKYVTRLGEGGRRSVTRGPKFRDVTSKSYAIRYQNTNFELLIANLKIIPSLSAASALLNATIRAIFVDFINYILQYKWRHTSHKCDQLWLGQGKKYTILAWRTLCMNLFNSPIFGT